MASAEDIKKLSEILEIDAGLLESQLGGFPNRGSTLDMPVMLPPVPSVVDFSEKKVLIADDVADTGRTIELVHSFIKDQVDHVRTAVIYEKSQSVIKCDYVWRRTDQWINFPWSSEDPVVQRAGQVLDA